MEESSSILEKSTLDEIPNTEENDYIHSENLHTSSNCNVANRIKRKKFLYTDGQEFTTPIKYCECGGKLKAENNISAVLYDLLGVLI